MHRSPVNPPDIDRPFAVLPGQRRAVLPSSVSFTDMTNAAQRDTKVSQTARSSVALLPMGHRFHLAAKTPPTSGSANQDERRQDLTENPVLPGNKRAVVKASTSVFTSAVTSAAAPVSQVPPPGAPGSGVMGAKVDLSDLSSSGPRTAATPTSLFEGFRSVRRLLAIVTVFLPESSPSCEIGHAHPWRFSSALLCAAGGVRVSLLSELCIDQTGSKCRRCSQKAEHVSSTTATAAAAPLPLTGLSGR